MNPSVNRYGQLVIPSHGHTSIVNGIDCNLSEANEISLVLGFQSECFDNKDTQTFETVFNFHEAIND